MKHTNRLTSYLLLYFSETYGETDSQNKKCRGSMKKTHTRVSATHCLLLGARQNYIATISIDKDLFFKHKPMYF